MIPLFLEHVDAEERRFIRSAPQNAILSHAAQGSQTQGFQNHIPARGRKPDMLHVCPKHIGYFKTTSPQGDGNRFASDGFKRVNSPISKPHPRKGTETRSPPSGSFRSPDSLFQNHIPARGRKHTNPESSAICLANFKTTSPQGDGNDGTKPDQYRRTRNFKTTSPQGDGTHKGRLHEAKTSCNRPFRKH